MTPLPIDALNELRRLEKEATPFPWYEDALLFIGVDENGNGRGWFDLNPLQDDGTTPYTEEEANANVALIIKCREHLPALLDAAERLTAALAERDRYKAALEAINAPGCPTLRTTPTLKTGEPT